MKAGHAYVPLDVRQPSERLRQIAASARIDGIVCQDASDHRDRARRLRAFASTSSMPRPRDPELPRVPSDASAHVRLQIGIDGHAEGRRDRPSGADQHIERHGRALWEITADDVVVASSAITVDASIPELFIPLMTGARVVLADTETVLTGFELVALARQDEGHRCCRRRRPCGASCSRQASPRGPA